MTSRDFSTEKDKKETKQEAGSKILLPQPHIIAESDKPTIGIRHHSFHKIFSVILRHDSTNPNQAVLILLHHLELNTVALQFLVQFRELAFYLKQ